MRRSGLMNFFVVALSFGGLIIFCSGQGTCPDLTPSTIKCSAGDRCPVSDHFCVNGLCCPNCVRKRDTAPPLPPVLGAYVLQCDTNGNYVPEQCQNSTGECWCVTMHGEEIQGTRIAHGGVRSISKDGSNSDCLSLAKRYEFNRNSATGTVVNGQCPPPIASKGDCLYTCNVDSDCQISGQKCCSNGCGKICMKALTGAGGVQINVRENPGSCPPRFQLNQLVGVPENECGFDSDCFQGKKCCPTPKGRKCLTPDNIDLGQEQRPGLCPPVSLSLFGNVSAGFRNDRCGRDIECDPGLKCCDTNSGRACLTPLNVQSQVQPGGIQIQPSVINVGQEQCTGINEERRCGEVCPKSCDQINLPTPSWCTDPNKPCVPSCFCRDGFIRLDSRDLHSACIPISQCQSGAGPVGGPQIIGPGPFPLKGGGCPTGPLHPAVAQTIFNGQSRGCNSDNDCSGEQRCCNNPSLPGLNGLRCMCLDPNAVWTDRGTSCPETCQITPQVCSQQFTQGCFCVDGYVKLSSNPNAPCVPRTQCAIAIGTSFGASTFGGGATFGGGPFAGGQQQISKATAKFGCPQQNIEGTLTLEQIGNTVQITGTIRGLQPGQHGVHIHTFGDVSNGCGAVGSHYDPEHQDHGSPQSAVRHVGDLGNVNTDQSGVTIVNLNDNRISLNGPYPIVGRSIVIHERADDGGQGGLDSRRNGNSGLPICCAIIGILQ